MNSCTSIDLLALNEARTRFRSGFQAADLDMVMSVFADSITLFSYAGPSFYAEEGRRALAARYAALLERYHTEMSLVVVRYEVHGDFAVDYGWQQHTLVPKQGGDTRSFRTRYMANWRRFPQRGWLITRLIDNPEFEPILLDDELEYLKQHGPRLPL